MLLINDFSEELSLINLPLLDQEIKTAVKLLLNKYLK